MEATLVDRALVAKDTAAFWIEPADPFSFKPGQTLDVTLPEPLYRDDAGTTRTFSIASLPSEQRVMVATRLGGSAFKRTLMEAPLGLPLEIDGPFGSFTLHQNARKPAVFLAGGIGITPFHSIIGDATARCLPRSLTLIYSNRNVDDVVWLKDFEEWAARNPHLRLIATLTTQLDDYIWAHQTGRIDWAFLMRHLQPEVAENGIFYVAGPQRFVTAMQSLLPEIGADPDSIRAEEFPGY